MSSTASALPATGPRHGPRTRRIVIVAGDSLIVRAIGLAFRDRGDFHLVGYADGRRASLAAILGAAPDVVLVDDMQRAERSLELLEGLRRDAPQVALILLGLELDPGWLGRAFAAGATGVISKATHPAALATLVRETVDGHVFHNPSGAGGSAVPGPTLELALPLTSREREILRLVASGSTNGDIARRLWVTEPTVKFHLRNIYRKLDVSNRTEATHFAFVHGLVDPRPAAAEPELKLAV